MQVGHQLNTNTYTTKYQVAGSQTSNIILITALFKSFVVQKTKTCPRDSYMCEQNHNEKLTLQGGPKYRLQNIGNAHNTCQYKVTLPNINILSLFLEIWALKMAIQSYFYGNKDKIIHINFIVLT